MKNSHRRERARPSGSEFVRGLRSYLTRFGDRSTVKDDVKAGIVLGAESVPDGLAAGLLAGLNPLHGLYAYLFGTLGGALATGSVFMSVQATGAMAVVVSDVDAAQEGGLSPAGLATLGLLAGLIMLGLGIARLGSLVRFIPAAVLVGFTNAVAVNIVLGQIDNATGIRSEGGNRVLKTLDAVTHLFSWSWPSVFVAAVTILLIIVLERTRLGALAMVVAIIAGSLLAALLARVNGIDQIALIGDIAAVPRALPGPQLPDLSMIGALIIPAFSLALVGLVQGAAISGSIPNPDGSYPDASADFRGQGIANLASGIFQGMPVGGSMSATALVRAAGARTALANLVAGLVMVLSILAIAPAIGYVAMPALAGLLILIGVRTFKLHDLRMVWLTGTVQATVMSVTFVLTLLIPLQHAVLVGVGLSVVLFVVRQSNQVRIARWEFDGENPMPIESAPPRVLPPGEVVILAPYGSLFFAAAPVFESQLPVIPADADGAVVIVRLRGKDTLGSTFLRAMIGYSTRLQAAGGALMLSGVSAPVVAQLRSTGAMASIGEDRVLPERRRLGASLADAVAVAHAWREEHRGKDEA